jgi:serine/threonine-protein kinase
VSDQKLCPTCGTEYPLSERFCPRDGTALRSSNPQADLVGTIVGNNFHIIRKLGEGGMGTVYLAEHVKMGRKAALKVMNPGMNQDPDAIARFNREATNASKLSHPNICGIYDFGETAEGLIFLAMEFIEGDSLTAVIEKSGALAAPRAAGIIHQAADALQVAHDYGIVHRDLKPDNIMIARARDGGDMVKVVDFGIAKASSSDAQKVTKTGLVVGTPEYMSPEQLSGDTLDGRSDIYSLGLVAFNCLTGKLPFPSNSAQEAMIMRLTDQPKTLAEMKPEVAWPDALQAVMDKALARDVAHRYQNAAEFGRDIAKAVANMPATLAAEQGTQVMGAGAVAAAASARTVAAPSVPKTRVASPERGVPAAPTASTSSTASTASQVPDATTRKRGLPMPAIAAAAVILLGGGGWFAVQMLGGGAKVSPDSSAAPPSVTNPNAANPNAANPNAEKSGATPQPAGARGGAGNPAPLGGGGTTTQLSAPVTPPGAGGRKDGAAPAGGGAPPAVVPVTIDDKIEMWKEWTDAGTSDANANRAIADINATLPGLQGANRVRAYLYLGHGYHAVGLTSKACDAWQKGKDSPGGANERSLNLLLGDGGPCK